MMNIHKCTPQRGGANERGAQQEQGSVKEAEEQPLYQPGAVTGNMQNVTLEIADWSAAAGDKGSFTDILADWSAPQYLLAARRELAASPESAHQLKVLRHMIRDAVALQKGGYWTPRLNLDRERLALEQEKLKLAREIAIPKIKKRKDVTLPLTDKERLAIIDKVDEVMGLK